MEVNYDIEKITFNDLRQKISLPTFQRSIVWKENKKKQFISTIINGLPFGVLLLYQENIGKYSLIDGLQRFSTLCDYELTPSKYINFKEVCDNSVSNIINKCIEKSGLVGSINSIKEEFIFNIAEHFSLNKDINTADIVEKIVTRLSFLNESKSLIYGNIYGMIENLRRKHSISDLNIPVIIFKGDFSILSDIFENVNTNGCQLSKYDIYAARWSKYNIPVMDNDILNAVDEKYVSMQNSTQIEISGYEAGEVFRKKEINIFEYCFAIGKLIISVAEPLFNLSTLNASKDKIDKDKSKVDSIGFNIIAAILLDSPKKKDGIEKYFINVNHEQLSIFKNKIIECSKTVNDILNPYIQMIDGANVARYIESQITCIIATMFRIKYTFIKDSLIIRDSSFGPKEKQRMLNKFKEGLPLHYLYDILVDYWGNSGDSKIGTELKNNLSNNRYLTKINKGEMQLVLMDWIKLQDAKRPKQISKENRLFLNYIITKKDCNNIMSSKLKNKLEIDLIIPKKRYEKRFGTTSNVANICNLTFLPQFENKSKNTLTVYEMNEQSLTLYDLNDSILNILLYPSREEIDFITNDNLFTDINYNKFLKSRRDFLINTFMELFF